MPLTLTWNGPIGCPIDGDELRPETLATRAEDVVRNKVPAGNSTVELGAIFRVEGDGADGHLIFEGDLSPIRGLLSGMGRGRVELRGDGGSRLGMGMTGGSISVEGSVGSWAGAEMRGGLLHIEGNAGNDLGSSLPGSRVGMREGIILVEGDVGRDVGLAMRRGLIAVGGRSGTGLGRGLVAGSIFAFGAVDRGVGSGMKRGSIALFGVEDSATYDPSPTFEPTGSFRPHVLTIYLRSLQRLGFPVPEAAFASRIRRYNGDRLEGGRGEILVASPS